MARTANIHCLQAAAGKTGDVTLRTERMLEATVAHGLKQPWINGVASRQAEVSDS